MKTRTWQLPIRHRGCIHDYIYFKIRIEFFFQIRIEIQEYFEQRLLQLANSICIYAIYAFKHVVLVLLYPYAKGCKQRRLSLYGVNNISNMRIFCLICAKNKHQTPK